ncbi:sigma factor-like helix-turn-helix DNA-binding protein [Sporosarcina psychrophila]
MTEARAILTNYHALTERQYVGDTDAICALLDLATAVAKAQLTDRQAQALRLIYGEGMTQKDAGLAMGISQDNVSRLALTALTKVQAQIDLIEAEEIG